MKKRKVPLRQCVGCQEQKEKRDLVRIVCNKEGEISLDTTGKAPGRGAYLCNRKSCLERAMKNRGLHRSFKRDVPKEVYEGLLKEISEDESE